MARSAKSATGLRDGGKTEATRVCAWCSRTLGDHGGTLHGRASRGYGVCPDCLAACLDRMTRRGGTAALRRAS